MLWVAVITDVQVLGVMTCDMCHDTAHQHPCMSRPESDPHKHSSDTALEHGHAMMRNRQILIHVPLSAHMTKLTMLVRRGWCFSSTVISTKSWRATSDVGTMSRDETLPGWAVSLAVCKKGCRTIYVQLLYSSKIAEARDGVCIRSPQR